MCSFGALPLPLAVLAGAASPLLLTASAAASAQTMRIRQINHEAARNDNVGERVAHWKDVFREKGGCGEGGKTGDAQLCLLMRSSVC